MKEQENRQMLKCSKAAAEKAERVMQAAADGTVKAYQAIETGAVKGYQTVENAVVGAYTRIEDAFVNKFLRHEGESTAEAKARLQAQVGADRNAVHATQADAAEPKEETT